MDSGKRILLVEDETLVAMLVEDMIADLGHQIVGPASQLQRAMELAGSEALDLAILDLNLGGVLSTPVADVLRERGVRYLFTTGYGEKGVPQAHGDAPVLSKPFALAQLERTIGQLLR